MTKPSRSSAKKAIAGALSSIKRKGSTIKKLAPKVAPPAQTIDTVKRLLDKPMAKLQEHLLVCGNLLVGERPHAHGQP